MDNSISGKYNPNHLGFFKKKFIVDNYSTEKLPRLSILGFIKSNIIVPMGVFLPLSWYWHPKC